MYYHAKPSSFPMVHGKKTYPTHVYILISLNLGHAQTTNPNTRATNFFIALTNPLIQIAR